MLHILLKIDLSSYKANKHHLEIKGNTLLSTISYLNKTVISLYDTPTGYVIGEQENNKMIMIITDDSKKDKFIIPSCKVISVDKRNVNNLIVDIECHEAGNIE
jgi:hypothetical protein